MTKLSLYQKPLRWVWLGKLPVRLNPSFRAVLWCCDVLEDEVLSEEDKIDLCLWRLIRFRPLRLLLRRPQKIQLFQIIFEQLVNTGAKKRQEQKAMDFRQDASYILASFRQCYGLDLVGKDRDLHWWEFLALLNGLSDDTRIMQVVSIRTRPIPKPTKYNAEERASIARLKREYALELTEEERKEQFQRGLQKIAVTLQNMAKRK